MEIDDKKLKEILAEQREEYQSHFDVVVEDFNSNVAAIAEQLTDVQENISMLKEDVSVLKEDVSVLKEDVGAIKEMVAQNTEDIEVMKADLHIIKDDLKEKVGRDEFKILERRVEILEKKA